MNRYLAILKNGACVGCHQLGNAYTRTIPKELGTFASSHEAWVRRLQSGQAGAQMTALAAAHMGGLPYKYLAEWSDRIAAGAVPALQAAAPGRHRTQHRRHRARLDESESLRARPHRHRLAQSDGQRPRADLRRAGAEHRRVPDSRSRQECRDHFQGADSRCRCAGAGAAAAAVAGVGRRAHLDQPDRVAQPDHGRACARVVHRAGALAEQHARFLQGGLGPSVREAVPDGHLRAAARASTTRRRRNTPSSTPASPRSTSGSPKTRTTRCGRATTGRTTSARRSDG